jgi:chromatin segregation and condensation protein Rec8/ScpA/Scc1 (kleisin family)
VEMTRIAEIPIEELIGCTWEGVLERLTSDMDPWDIDIAVLAHRYRDYVQALRELEFEIPGRMVLTCSILLRMKSDDLLAMERPTDRDGLVAELEDAIDQDLETWEIPSDPDEFYLPVLRRPKRQVTILDLRNALAAAMKVSRRRAERLIGYVELEENDPFENYEIGGTDFAGRLRVLFDKIKDLLSGRRVLSFFRLLDRGDKLERVERFFEILHLAAEGQITCSQAEFLGDILIKLTADE